MQAPFFADPNHLLAQSSTFTATEPVQVSRIRPSSVNHSDVSCHDGLVKITGIDFLILVQRMIRIGWLLKQR